MAGKLGKLSLEQLQNVSKTFRQLCVAIHLLTSNYGGSLRSLPQQWEQPLPSNFWSRMIREIDFVLFQDIFMSFFLIFTSFLCKLTRIFCVTPSKGLKLYQRDFVDITKNMEVYSKNET